MRSFIFCAALAGLICGCGAHDPGAGSSGSTGGTSGSGYDAGPCGTDGWDNFAGPLFASQCESCHQHTTEFATQDQVVAKEAAIASFVAQGLMPQGAPLAPDLQARLTAWFGCGAPQHGGAATVDAGTPTPAMCAQPPDPLTATWQGANPDGSANMLPGENCLACHYPGQPNASDTVTYAGGTVFENQLSNTGAGLVTVTLVDADGGTQTATSHTGGNFYFTRPMTPPFTVSITALDGGTTYMNEPAPSGACNACHRAPPTCGAPGHVGLQIVAAP